MPSLSAANLPCKRFHIRPERNPRHLVVSRPQLRKARFHIHRPCPAHRSYGILIGHDVHVEFRQLLHEFVVDGHSRQAIRRHENLGLGHQPPPFGRQDIAELDRVVLKVGSYSIFIGKIPAVERLVAAELAGQFSHDAEGRLHVGGVRQGRYAGLCCRGHPPTTHEYLHSMLVGRLHDGRDRAFLSLIGGRHPIGLVIRLAALGNGRNNQVLHAQLGEFIDLRSPVLGGIKPASLGSIILVPYVRIEQDQPSAFDRFDAADFRATGNRRRRGLWRLRAVRHQRHCQNNCCRAATACLHRALLDYGNNRVTQGGNPMVGSVNVPFVGQSTSTRFL